MLEAKNDTFSAVPEPGSRKVTKSSMVEKCIYRVAHKNFPNFATMLYYLTIEFRQKERTFLKSNHNEQYEKL